MSIVTINASDRITDSRAVINANFSELDTGKLAKASNLSDVTTKNTALNNLLPTQTGNAGKQLQTDGANTSWQSPSGSPLATNVVQGITALTVVAADPLLPKAVGDNDPRMLTTDQKAACAGTGTPSGANKFVTADTDALKELLTNKDTTVTLGTSDTKYPSQNAVKTYVDTQDATIMPIKYKASDENVSNSTTKQNDNDLYFTGVANKMYLIEMFLLVNDSNGDADFKFNWSLPSGATFDGKEVQVETDGGRDVSEAADWVDDVADTNDHCITLTGILKVSSTGGTCNFQWAQNTARVPNTTVKAGSWMIYKQLN